jgi:hypothetical protein
MVGHNQLARVLRHAIRATTRLRELESWLQVLDTTLQASQVPFAA